MLYHSSGSAHSRSGKLIAAAQLVLMFVLADMVIRPAVSPAAVQVMLLLTAAVLLAGWSGKRPRWLAHQGNHHRKARHAHSR